MKIIFLPIFLVACVAICVGQSNKNAKPDLSGTWEFDVTRNHVPKSKMSTPEQIKITHHDPEMIIHRKISINGVSEERDLTYYTDGRGENNPATVWITSNPRSESFWPVVTNSKTIWSKDKIVSRAFSRSSVGNATVESEIEEEYRLSPDGKTLTKTTRTIPTRLLSANGAFMVGHGVDFKTVYNLISK